MRQFFVMVLALLAAVALTQPAMAFDGHRAPTMPTAISMTAGMSVGSLAPMAPRGAVILPAIGTNCVQSAECGENADHPCSDCAIISFGTLPGGHRAGGRAGMLAVAGADGLPQADILKPPRS